MPPIHEAFIEHKSSFESSIGEPLSVNGLVGPLRIYQRLKGQRHSIDDAATAWYALQKYPEASRTLDLGCGSGTVGLAVLWGLSGTAALTCIEAQEISFKLLQANISCNGLQNRVRAIHGDLRDLNLDEKFPLITGSPPYFPPGAGVLPLDPQKAHARFELRGDLSDYARVAKRHLEPDGMFVYCFPFRQKNRGKELVRREGFSIVSIRDIIPRRGQLPLFSVYSARLNWDQPTVEETPLIVADDNGRYSAEMLRMQESRGFGPEGTNKIA